VPAHAVAVGSPARVVKRLDRDFHPPAIEVARR
jgi:serine acetyltransferase